VSVLTFGVSDSSEQFDTSSGDLHPGWEEALPPIGEDPRPKPKPRAQHGVRVLFEFTPMDIGPGELGIPRPGQDPRPPRPGSRRVGERMVFGPSLDVVEGDLGLLHSQATRWATELHGRLPSGTRLHSIEHVAKSSRYAINVLASAKSSRAVLDSVRSTIGSQGSDFSIRRF
jgi:hypothetical protein